MKNKKRFIIGGLAAGIAVAILLALALTRGAVNAADQFLTLVGQGQVDAAYQSTAQVFQQRTQPDRFKAIVRRYGLLEYASSSWSSRSMENDRGAVKGTLQLKGGKVVPMAMQLLKEGGAWRVAGFVVEGGVAARPEVPSEAEIKQLIGRAVQDFSAAIRARDFTAFHKTLALVWQQQTSPQKLNEIFKEFIDKQVDFAPLKALEPALSAPPAIDNDGVLTVEGSYRSRPAVNFRLRFIEEENGWRPLGVKIDIPPTPSAAEPSPPIAKSAPPAKSHHQRRR